ncbi:DUF1592 domain-containing protein [Blastopirellula marina]|uniref:Cytochrome c domain-containing protein n=1 Tax=Blastopirellula marina TaxID=124 RepID=A0A2S8G1W5_9BACT|nr:DUF1592 domain-containing protein [Blastopirellula marina]PQO38437.1 hypothetical protein C5Y98_10275 [Blastopirellula marina]PTL45094.1 DUF1592 domain-containing protein [Blastopirellula marina]
MHTNRLALALLGGLFALVLPQHPALSAEQADVRAFFKTHCIECHGEETQEGKIRLDTLEFPSPENDTAHVWTRVVNAVERGEMPPDYQEQPADSEKQALVTQIVQTITSTIPQPSALRRLNRLEYERSVHDLLGVDVPLADLLPEDGLVQGFDKGGDGLNFSSVLMEQYLEAANVAFDATIRRYAPLPAETRRADVMSIPQNIESVRKNYGGVIEVDNSFVKFTPEWPITRLDPVHPIEEGVYRCRIAVWPHDPGDRTLAVALYVGSMFGKDTRDFVGIFDVTGTSKEPRIIEFTQQMSEGDTIHILPRVWPEHITWRDKNEKRPGVGIVWAETYGPLDQSFPAKSTQKLFGDVSSISMNEKYSIWMRNRKGVKYHVVESTQPEADIERILRDFVPRAFRRPVSDEEVRPFIELALGRLAGGRSFEESVRSGITAVLCSPHFLLLNCEPVVDDYTIASRLSYFLWSTMPDETLLQLAAEGKLSDPAVRNAQVERMIQDPKIETFVNDFTGQWLDLRDIEFTTPDKFMYPEYDPLLLEAMKGETHHFFQHMLQEDLSVMNFVDSDWTFLNQRLAAHYGFLDRRWAAQYGFPLVEGHEHFQKFPIPSNSKRGGVLTHASVMKVTANGTTTSPVIRGVWVADKLLGRPVPPPPPGVPAVEPDIRGATTIRQQLEKHRANADCASCHKRIDPAGFALEEFDAIGSERRRYRLVKEGDKIYGKSYLYPGPPVMSGDNLPDGRKFASYDGFRQCLMQDQAFVKRAIAEKLLIYATGRTVGLAQREYVDQIVAEAAKHDDGLKSMIHAVVANDLFVAP